MIIIIFGVSGSGKTTIGKTLSTALKMPFYDADNFHPQKNIDKMHSGIPLTDKDRQPWLKILSKKIKLWKKNSDAILACSALKEDYRKTLKGNNDDVKWIFLNGSFELIKSRMQKRKNHFMKPELLKSQFNTLEIPNYAIDISVNQKPNQIVESILQKIKPVLKSDIGIVGLGVMGKSLCLNLLQKGFTVSVYNRPNFGESKLVSNFLKNNTQYQKLKGFTDLGNFVSSLKSPRQIFMMITSGKPIDDFITRILPFLKPKDCLIDGGNSFFEDTKIREKLLKNKQIYYLGIGVSGGESGALSGPSLMVGGSKIAYNNVAFILEKMAAKDLNNLPCCAYLGKNGAGHFVKIVHNGIEYAEMQLLAEMFAIMSISKSYKEISNIFKNWNKTDLKSYLLEITQKIVTTKLNNKYILDVIIDKAENKGTGSWSSQVALKLGLPNSTIHAAVMARHISSLKEKRILFSKQLKIETKQKQNINLTSLTNAYRFAQIINLHQGFELLKAASKYYNWNYSLQTIARIWTQGCIIKSDLMRQATVQFKNYDAVIDNPYFYDRLKSYEKDIATILKQAIDLRISTPVFNAAYQYWVGLTTGQSSANLIQAQRDYFGAHTFKRIDKPKTDSFHFNWPSI